MRKQFSNILCNCFIDSTFFTRKLCQFYFNQHSKHNFTHVGHCKRSPGDSCRGVRDANAESLQLISKLFENHCPVAIAQQFLEISDGSKLPLNSINKLRDAILMRKYGVAGKESTAETSLRILDNDDSQSYICCTGSYDQAKQLVRVRRKRKKNNTKPTIDEKKCAQKEHERYAMDIANALSLGNGKFLIAIAWLDESAKHYHKLHPEVLGFDVQFRTNSEKRGLYRGCSMSADGRNLPNLLSFIPSVQS